MRKMPLTPGLGERIIDSALEDAERCMFGNTASGAGDLFLGFAHN